MAEVSQDLLEFIKTNNPDLDDAEVMRRAREISGLPVESSESESVATPESPQEDKPTTPPVALPDALPETLPETPPPAASDEKPQAVKEFQNERVGQWTKSIIGFEWMNPADVVANDKNWRLHPDLQQEAMTAALSQIGWIAPVLLNETTGKLIDGHLRVALALANNQESIPVAILRLTEDEENLALLTFDPLSAMAATDASKFEELTKQISSNIDTSLHDLIQAVGGAAGLYDSTDEDINDMADEYGVDDDVDTDMYPDIRVKQVDPVTTKRFEYIFRAAEGKTESEKFGNLVEILYQNPPLAGRARKIEQDDKVASE